MNEQKAKNMLQAKLTYLELDNSIDGCDGDCPECEYCYTQGTFGEQKEALKIAIKALEKQIPKKPVLHDGFMTVARCSVCNEVLPLIVKYCNECGNAIDWTVEE